MKPLRPYRVTIPGGRCIGTYSSADRARARALQMVMSGKAAVVWVRHRTGVSWERIGGPATLADQ